MFKLSRWPLAQTHIMAPIIIFLLAIIAFATDQFSADIFIYDRSSISTGEIWRLLTGHIYHTNFNHLALNLAALIMLWALHGQYYNTKSYLALFVFSGLFISSALYFFSVDLTQYVGLSGILHAVFIWGALNDIKQGEKTGYLLFIGVWLKIAHEQFYGASASVVALIAANVAVDAHLWGAISGLIFFLIQATNSKMKDQLINS
jgi:rhomboid family GlyGly-CTERM serine protease